MPGSKCVKRTLERDQWEGYDAFLRTVWMVPTVEDMVVHEADVLRARISELRREP